MELTSIQPTILTYMQDSHQTEAKARVLAVDTDAEKGSFLVLDQTIFYPQGGGQPADKGQIFTADAVFEVTDVRRIDGVVHHYGHFSKGSFAPHAEVNLRIDFDLRRLHMRLHSAGHLIDAAAQSIGLTIKPTKGYHFPNGPYVEYEGEIQAEQREDVRVRWEQKVNELVNKQMQTEVVQAEQAQMMELCGFMPDYVSFDKPVRVVSIVPKMGCPCGGTHVKSSADIGQITLPKLRCKGGQTRISYSIT